MEVKILQADLKDYKTRCACPFLAPPTRPPLTAPAPKTSSRPGTSSRPKFYLLDNKLAGPLISSKLSRTKYPEKVP